MSKTPWHVALFVLAMFLLMPAAAFAQEGKPSDHPPSNPQNAKAVNPADKPSLKSVTLVSSDAVARKVAEEESAKAQASKTNSKHSKQAETSKATDGAVLEFHPTDSPPVQPGKGTFQLKNRKKSALKNVHGSVYGAAASAVGGAHGEGGAVGANSGNGKLGVYVEGERTHANTPVPH
jgi:hypothetical protein